MKPITRHTKLSMVVKLLSVASLLTIVWWYALPTSQGYSLPEDLKITSVENSRFVKSVPALGEVRMSQPSVIHNNCRYWPRKIIELTPEGTMVEEGDVICVLDGSEIRNKLLEQKLLLIQATAGYETAKVTEVLQQVRNERRLSENSLAAATAVDEFITFDEAESVQDVRRLEGDVSLKQDQLELAYAEFDRARDLSERGYVQLPELERRRTEWQFAERSSSTAEGLLNLTRSFQHKRRRIELSSTSVLSSQELKRTEQQNDLALTIQKVKSLEMQQKVVSVQGRVDYLERALAACTIRAPRSGELIYSHKRDEGKYVEVDAEVYYTQELFWIGDRSRLVVAGRVNATRVFELFEGAPAEVSLLTNADTEFAAKLTWVAPIPSPAAWFLPNELYHDIQLVLSGEEEALAQIAFGTQADCRIIIDSRNDVLQVPVEAILRHRDTYAVVVKKGNMFTIRPVQLGSSNDRTVEVTGGVIAGEMVLLGPQSNLQDFAQRLSESSTPTQL